MNKLAWILVASIGVLCTSCSTSAEDPEAPSCNLPEKELESRIVKISSFFKEHSRDMKELPDGFAFRFDGGRKIHNEVSVLALEEKACCSFLTCEIDEPRDGSFWVRLIGAKEFVRAHLGDLQGG